MTGWGSDTKAYEMETDDAQIEIDERMGKARKAKQEKRAKNLAKDSSCNSATKIPKCPYNDPNHNHQDGCPGCFIAELEKEAKHNKRSYIK